MRVASNAESTEAISRRISLDNVGDGGSQVRFGDLQIIPVGEWADLRASVLRVGAAESGSTSTVTEFRSVIVSYNDRAVLEPTLAEALARAVPGVRGRDRRSGRHAGRTDERQRIGIRRRRPRPRRTPDTPNDETDPGTALDAAQLLDAGRRPLRRSRRGARRRRSRHLPGQDRRGPGPRHPGAVAPRRTDRLTRPEIGPVTSRAGGGVRRVRPGPGGTGSGSGPARRRGVRRCSWIGSMSLPISVSWLASSVDTDVTRSSSSVIRRVECRRTRRSQLLPGRGGSPVARHVGAEVIRRWLSSSTVDASSAFSRSEASRRSRIAASSERSSSRALSPAPGSPVPGSVRGRCWLRLAEQSHSICTVVHAAVAPAGDDGRTITTRSITTRTAHHHAAPQGRTWQHIRRPGSISTRSTD